MVAALTPELEQFIATEIAIGHFSSREQVIAAAISDFRDRQHRLELLRNELALDDDANSEEGDILETDEDFDAFAEDVIARGRERLAREHQPL